MNIKGNFANNANVILSSVKTSINVSGNYTDSSSSILSFGVQSNSSAKMNVNGGAQVNGILELNLTVQPKQGVTVFILIDLGNSKKRIQSLTPNVNDSQIQVVPNYNGSECDTITSQIVNQPTGIGVTLTTTLGNKCGGGGGLPLGAIIGIAVEIPCEVINHSWSPSLLSL